MAFFRETGTRVCACLAVCLALPSACSGGDAQVAYEIGVVSRDTGCDSIGWGKPLSRGVLDGTLDADSCVPPETGAMAGGPR